MPLPQAHTQHSQQGNKEILGLCFQTCSSKLVDEGIDWHGASSCCCASVNTATDAVIGEHFPQHVELLMRLCLCWWRDNATAFKVQDPDRCLQIPRIQNEQQTLYLPLHTGLAGWFGTAAVVLV